MAAYHVWALRRRGDLTVDDLAEAADVHTKVLLYAYATGVFSSRRIARKLEEDVAFRVLGAGNLLQHRTLCEFRRRHLADFKQLFAAVVRLARELGLAHFRESVDRRHEGSCEREQAQGDELRSDAGARAAALGR